MARTARIKSEIGVYLINLKAVDNVVFSQDDRFDFLSSLLENDASVLAYTLFNNSFFFVLRENERAVDVILRRSSIKFVKSFNKKYLRSGKVFSGRYSSYPAHDIKDVWNFVANTHKMTIVDKDNFSSMEFYFEDDYVDSNFALKHFGNKENFYKVCNDINSVESNIKLNDDEVKNYIINTFQIQPCNLVKLPETKIDNVLNQIFTVTKASARQIARITSLPLRFLWDKAKKIKVEPKKEHKNKVQQTSLKIMGTKEDGKCN